MTTGRSLQDDLGQTVKCNAVSQWFRNSQKITPVRTIDSLSEKPSQVRNEFYVFLPDRM